MAKPNSDFYPEVPATDAKDEPKFVYSDVPATDEDGNLIDPAKSGGGSKSGKPAGKAADDKE